MVSEFIPQDQRMPASSVSICDDTTHGWGCFHLLDEKQGALTKHQLKELEELEQEVGEFLTIDELDGAITRAQRDLEDAQERVDEAEAELDMLRDLRDLMSKRQQAPANVMTAAPSMELIWSQDQ